MSSGSKGDSNAYAREEEARKEVLRDRIDRVFGVKTERPVMGIVPEGGNLYSRALSKVTPRVVGYEPDPEALAAKANFEAENKKIADSTRSYHTDALGEKFRDNERATRFSLARRGLLGGSEEINQQGEIAKDRDLGATRVDEAVQRAIAQMNTEREQERLSALSLVNAGAGEAAVSSASAGLRNAFENVSTAQKADLFGDLFASAADARTGANQTAQQQAMAQRYRDRLNTFFPAGRTSSSGRVTSTG